MSIIPQETTIRVRARTTPITVESERRGLRPIPRIVIRQRTGNRRSGGISRSARLSRRRRAGAKRRIASAGGTRAAAAAGSTAATAPVSSPKPIPISAVSGEILTKVIGIEAPSCRRG